MKKIIGVKFRGSGKVYYFDPQELEIKIDDAVIVETARGTVFGTVCEPARYIPDEQTVAPLKPVIRIATEEDKAQNARNVANEAQALATTQRKIEDRGLEMKLVGVDCSFDGFNYTFYYTSENCLRILRAPSGLISSFVKSAFAMKPKNVEDLVLAEGLSAAAHSSKALCPFRLKWPRRRIFH